MAPGSFTFLHAADLHLDSPLRGLSSYAGAPAAALRLATREAFGALVQIAIEREVAFVILAGDLFDGDWPDYDSGLWFNARMRELEEAHIEVFAVRGNHDAESRVTRKLSWPKNVHVFDADAPETHRLDELGVALHGQSFPEAHIETNLALDYPLPIEGLLNVGVLHTALEGREGHGRYAPCTVDDLRAKGYDYWALGHVHQREVVCQDPWIVFPGNIQGRHVRETGPKGATLVHVEEGRVQRLEELVGDVWRWDRVSVDLTGVAEEAQLLRAVEEALAAASAAADGRPVAARITLAGATELDGALRIDAERIRAEVRAAGLGAAGELWVEKVVLATQPLADPEDEQAFAGLAGRVVQAELSAETLARIARELTRLSERLPAEAREALDPRDVRSLGQALDPARRYLAALLTKSPETEA